MIEIIEITPTIYKHAKEMSEDSYDEYMTLRAVANGIVLPNNPINGNIITAMFDIVEFRTISSTIFVVLKDGTELKFKRDWFNAPYKRKVIK